MCIIAAPRFCMGQSLYGSRSKGRHKAYVTESLFKLFAKVFS